MPAAAGPAKKTPARPQEEKGVPNLSQLKPPEKETIPGKSSEVCRLKQSIEKAQLLPNTPGNLKGRGGQSCLRGGSPISSEGRGEKNKPGYFGGGEKCS